MRISFLAILVLVFIFNIPNSGVAAKARKKIKVPRVETPVDWGEQASGELAAVRNVTAKPAAKSRSATSGTPDVAPMAHGLIAPMAHGLIAPMAHGLIAPAAHDLIESQPQSLTDAGSIAVLPTAATVRAEVNGTRSIIERSALRFTFLFEPYQPSGTATLAGGQSVAYSNLPTTVLGQIDLRWLPFDVGSVRGQSVLLGGYIAGGYSRSTVPLVAPSGFRYDDVALNTIRFEGGVAAGTTMSEKWNLEARAGVGRVLIAQTSKYSDVVGSYDRPYLVGAFDVSYHIVPRFALVGSIARRTPLSDGKGSIAFDPLTVSGGFLVQVR